uniref:Disease resistance N-terminal domain-containing protein n=1 Tax=Oryza punctata TaxID=4537 RepID=A0A0E0MKL8_ORYPU
MSLYLVALSGRTPKNRNMATAVLVFAGKSVATPAISFFVNKAFSYLNKYRKAEGLEAVKNRLEENIPKIQSVIDVVDPDYIKDKSEALDAWLWQLRDAVEEAEDAIDELEVESDQNKSEGFCDADENMDGVQSV